MRLTFLLTLLAPALVFAQGLDLTQLSDARGFAMGGAFRVLGASADSTDGNPASMLAFHSYQVEATGAWDASLKTGFGGLAIRDSKTSTVAAGLSYHLEKWRDLADDTHTAHQWTLAVGIPLSERIFFGFSGKYVYEKDPHLSAATGDVGLEVSPTEGLYVGISGHNLISTNHPELARYYSAGAAFSQGPFALEFDVLGDPGADAGFKPSYHVGGEAIISQSVPFRLGFQADTLTDAKYLSGGIGFLGEGGGVDFGYRHRLDQKGDLLVLSLKLVM